MFFLIKWFAPYIPALKCRALRRFFGKGVVIRQIDFELAESGGFSINSDSDPLVKKGEKKTINFRLSNGAVLYLECENDFSESDLLRLRAPVFTVRDR